MDNNILVTGIGALLLLIFSFRKWAKKGDIFHAGFIFSIINFGFFIVFAFGPYEYFFNLPWSYYYMYILIGWMFILGLIWGEAKGNKLRVKEIKINSAQLFFLYILVVAASAYTIFQSKILNDYNLQEGVINRTEQLNQEDLKVNIASFILGKVETSFTHIVAALVTAYAVYRKKNYVRIIFLFLILTAEAIFTNARTTFILGVLLIFITSYTVLKEQGFVDFSKIKWSKNFKFTIPALILTIFVIGFMTNIRSSVIASEYSVPYEYIESITHLKRKNWFNKFAHSQPVSLVNPIAELSIYAGSTVAHGGLVADIAIDSNLRTWGLRNFFSIQRILAQLGLDAGISKIAVHNYYNLVAKAEAYLPFIKYSWWGFPANLIIDFGYIGAPLASLVTGWLMGWIYGCVSQGVIILKSISYALILSSIILTPALGPFSDFTNFTTLSLLICYILMRSVKIKYQNLS